MRESKYKRLPKFGSVEKVVQFFDKHDLGDYLNGMPEVRFEVDIKKSRHIFTIDEKIAEKVEEIARDKKISPEKLVNDWLKEKVFART